MKLEKLMKTDIEICRTFDSVESAAAKMLSRNIGFLPVCDDKEEVVGTITDRDLAIRVIAEKRNPSTTLIQDVMSRDPVCCGEDDDLATVRKLMAESHVSRIVVVDDDQHAVGVVSLSDIAQQDKDRKTGALLREISEREAPPQSGEKSERD